MAGVYGEINSNADFHRVLDEATETVRCVLTHTPTSGMMQQILNQLEAMKLWSDNGCEPSESERSNIDVGLIAARELSDATGDVKVLAEKLMSLNNYFEDWPTDAKAASATDEDFFDDDDDE